MDEYQISNSEKIQKLINNKHQDKKKLITKINSYTSNSLTDFPSKSIEKIKNPRKNNSNYLKIINSIETRESLRSSFEILLIRFRIFEYLENIFKNRSKDAFFAISKYAKKRILYTKLIIFSRVFSLFLKNSKLRMKKFLEKFKKSSTNYSKFYQLLEQKLKKLILRINFRIFKSQSKNLSRLSIRNEIYQKAINLISLHNINKKFFIFRNWKDFVTLKKNKMFQTQILYFYLKRILFLNIFPIFQMIKSNEKRMILPIFAFLDCVKSLIKRKKQSALKTIFFMSEKQKKCKSLRYKLLILFKNIAKTYKNIKVRDSQLLLRSMQENLNSYHQLIYSLNTFTILTTKLKFSFMYHSLVCLKNNQIFSKLVQKIQGILDKRLFFYFSQLCNYFNTFTSLGNIVKNFTTLKRFYNYWHKFYAFRNILEMPMKVRKPVISYNRLLLNIKIKKEKEITSIKQSMNTPKLIKNNSLNIPGMFSPENKQNLCSTDRRNDYFIRLKNKKLKKNKGKSIDIICNFKKFTPPIRILIKSLLKPISRIFFYSFRIKESRKSFIFITKEPPTSPKIIF